MMAVSSLVAELEDSIARGSKDRRVETLRRVTDLFLMDADAYQPEHVEVFDIVIARLTAAIETRARADLARRLADVPNAPPGVIRSLAHDEIAVARPVLTRSSRLSDADLVSVAIARGRDHMLAISERPTLSEQVTDVLVTKGDDVVAHAVAGNGAARLSPRSLDALVEKSRADDALRLLLSQRIDVPQDHLRQLMAVAKEAARQRLAASLPAADSGLIGHAVDQGAVVIAEKVATSDAEAPIQADAAPKAVLSRNYEAALAEIMAAVERNELNEFVITEYAGRGQFEECVCAVAALANISLPTAERLFLGSDQDLLLIVCKAQNWAWSTARALVRLRGDGRASARDLDRAMDSYDQLTHGTAQRVLRFLHIREASAARPAPAQTRTNVR